MSLYAAERCSFDSHARNLAKNSGGEFITIMWLVFKYHFPPVVTASKDLIRLKEAEEEEGIGEEELKQYDGSDPTKPLLMAIKGKIYDVTESRTSFGPGGQYSLFAAKDASRAIAKMSFEPEDLSSDISGLEPFELDALKDWEDKFISKYPMVGIIKKSVPLQREETRALPSI
ncbi:unnamed protein product [Urochloa humidicola]